MAISSEVYYAIAIYLIIAAILIYGIILDSDRIMKRRKQKEQNDIGNRFDRDFDRDEILNCDVDYEDPPESITTKLE